MDVVSVDSLDESYAFFNSLQSHAYLFDNYAHVGAITLQSRSRDQWYWVDSGNRITYLIKWEPGFPNSAAEYCLSVKKKPTNEFVYDDIPCFGSFEVKFIYQSVDYNF
jgi:hypothetical protein